MSILTPMFGIKKRVLVVGLFLLISLIAWLLLRDVITIEVFQAKQDALEVFVNEYYVLALILFLVLYTISAATAFPLGGVFVFSAGFLFGTVVGTAVSVFAATLGGVIVFFIARYGFKEWIETTYGKYLAPLEKELLEHPASYLLFLRFMPVVPYIVINVVPALVNVRFSTFLWTSIVGLLPGAFIFALAGSGVSHIASTGNVVAPSLVFALLLLAGISLAPMFYRKYKRFRDNNGS